MKLSKPKIKVFEPADQTVKCKKNILTLGKFNNLWVLHKRIKPMSVVQLCSSNNGGSEISLLKIRQKSRRTVGRLGLKMQQQLCVITVSNKAKHRFNTVGYYLLQPVPTYSTLLEILLRYVKSNIRKPLYIYYMLCFVKVTSQRKKHILPFLTLKCRGSALSQIKICTQKKMKQKNNLWIKGKLCGQPLIWVWPKP